MTLCSLIVQMFICLISALLTCICVLPLSIQLEVTESAFRFLNKSGTSRHRKWQHQQWPRFSIHTLPACLAYYWQNLHWPLVGISCSSTHTSLPELKSIGRRCVHLPDWANGGKLVLSEMWRSIQLVIKTGSGVYPEFGVIHGGSEDCTSAMVITEAAGGFPLKLVHTRQNQVSNVCFLISVIDFTPVSHYMSFIQVCHVDNNVDDLKWKINQKRIPRCKSWWWRTMSAPESNLWQQEHSG